MTADSLAVSAVLLPAGAAILIGLLNRRPNLRETTTLLTGILLMVVVGMLLRSVLRGEEADVVLLPMLPGIPLRLAAEPLGLLFAAVASLLWPINSLYSFGYMRGNREAHQTRFYVCFAIAISSAMGVALAGNLVTLFTFYEILSLSTYPLVTHKGDIEARAAGRIYLGMLLTTSVALFLPAIVWVHHLAGTGDFLPGGALAQVGQLPSGTVGLLLALFLFGIGKSAVMPVHRWLPAAMVAPTPVSALLHAVAVVKAGVFAVVKVVAYVFGVELLQRVDWGDLLLAVSAITILAASVVALRTALAGGNLKRMLAYSTVSQLSYVVLAGALFTPLGLTAASLHIVAHAFGKITLFFAAGAIYTAAHKTEISELGGIGRRMPWTMGAFTVGALSMIGLPPTGGCLSKWFIFSGAMAAENGLALVVLMISTLLNAGYFIPILHRAFLGRGAPSAFEAKYGAVHPGEHGSAGEAPWPLVAATCSTAFLSVLFFFFPEPFLTLARFVSQQMP